MLKPRPWVPAHAEDRVQAIAATVAGTRPNTGGAVCDRLLPAVAADLGIAATGPPARSPR